MSEFNFKSQICTTREQSERLLALGLKKETADMVYAVVFCGNEITVYPDPVVISNRANETKYDIPSWSLHRLLRLIAISLNISNGITIALPYDIPFDDCIERIEHLIKEGYFNKEYLV